MPLDLSTYAVDLDTPRPDGQFGDSPRGAFIKVNGAWQAIQDYINASVGSIGPEPAATFPYMLWLDTVSDPAVMYRRNAADDAWVDLGSPFYNAEDADANLLATIQVGRKNLLINGNFDIWQRGSAQTVSGFGSADRWSSAVTGSTQAVNVIAFTLGQTNVPGNPTFYYQNTVTSVPGAGNYVLLSQKIENVRTAQGNPVTLSFYAKADSPKNIAIEFLQLFGDGGSPSPTVFGIGGQKIALTASWQKYTVTVDIPSIAGKTLGTNGNNALMLCFWFDAGSTYNDRTDSLGQQSGTFGISKVQLELGSKATEFEDRHPAQEVELCQRYLRAFGGDSVNPVIGWGQCTLPTAAAVQVHLGNMRAIPALVYSGSFIILNASGNAVAVTSMAIGPGGTNRKIARIGVNTASGLVSGDATVLCGGDINAKLFLDAEI